MNNKELILLMQQMLISKGENPSIANWIFCEVNNLASISQITSIESNDVNDKEKYLNYLKRYLDGEPLARIFKHFNFYYHDFNVHDGVFCPRLDTEILVDKVLELCKNKSNLNILDMCAGTGIIGLSLKLSLPKSKVTCIDINPLAINNIKDNANKLGVEISIIESNLFSNLKSQKFNVFVCNPPYISRDEELSPSVIKYDPDNALFADNNGLAIYEQIIMLLKHHITLDSYLIAFEIGYQQADAVKQLLMQFDDSCIIDIYKDYNYHDRVVIARKGF